MFMNLRRVHKCRCVRLLAAGLLVCMLLVSWDQLDHHVFSHIRSFTHRYLVNSYDFLNSSFAISSLQRSRTEGPDVAGGLVRSSYIINHPGKCVRGGADILLLLFVKSSPENFDRRRAIRDTWGNESYIGSELRASVRMVFALGVHPDIRWRSKVQSALLQEDQTYADLIQQDFVDTFHNLTTKLILQFSWRHRFCPGVRFLMSVDDDVFVHMPNLVRYLQQLVGRRAGATDLWVGHVHKGSPPVRRKDSKYHVPYELYPWPSYPDYTAGAAFVVSADVASKIHQATLLLEPSIYIDDVFMGICAKAMGVAPQEHAFFSGEGNAPDHRCIYDHMITSHGHVGDMRSLWRAATDPSVRSSSSGLLARLYCTAVRVLLLCAPHYRSTYACVAAFT